MNPFQNHTIPFDDWITKIVEGFRPFFQAIGLPIRWMLQNIEGILSAIPPLIFEIIISLIFWKLAEKNRFL